MADEARFKIQVSLKVDQDMLNVRGDSVEEVEGYLNQMFSSCHHLTKFAGVAPVQAQQDVQAMFGATVETADPMQLPPPTFAGVPTQDGPAVMQPQADPNPCKVCGGPKTKWVPPGFSSKSQKSYMGFFACPTNHR